jgi:hypothetical protein
MVLAKRAYKPLEIIALSDISSIIDLSKENYHEQDYSLCKCCSTAEH